MSRSMPWLSSRALVVVLLAVAVVSGLLATSDAGTGLALLALATIPALFAVPPRGRSLLGAAVVAAGVAVPLLGERTDEAVLWLGTAVLVLAGSVTVWRGGSWTALARRFDRGADGAAAPSDPRDLWSALDHGEDPTER